MFVMENSVQAHLYYKSTTNSLVEESSSVTETAIHVSAPTTHLRRRIRDYTKAHRGILRASTLDTLRVGVGEIKARIQELENLTEKDVVGLAGRIKRRKGASCEDMYRLSHSFLQDEKNIETFNKIPGATQVLVKEFTGKDFERQLSAAECLCNLSLGQAPVCEKISLLAGSYFVTYLHTTEHQLVRICLWTIANILTTGLKCALTMIKMQLLPELWKLYINDSVANDVTDFREEAAVCLHIIALNSEILLKEHDRQYVLEHLTEKNPTCIAGEYHLQIIFHTLFCKQEYVALLSFAQQQYLINYSLSNICNVKELKTASQVLRIIYAIRIIGNLIYCHPNSYPLLLQQVYLSWQSNLQNILNELFSFRNNYLTRELFWVLKNILNAESVVDPTISRNSLLEKLKIPLDSHHLLSNSEGK